MLPEIIEKIKSDEIEGKGPGTLSGTFDAKGEFEAGFKGSADFIDAMGDRVKLTSYSKREDTITTVVAGGPQSSRLTSYTRKVNGNLPIDNHTEPAILAYAEMEEHVNPEATIDGPMSGHARLPSSSPRDRKKPSDISVSPFKLRQQRLSSGSYQDPFSPAHTNHTNGHSPGHISSNSFGYEGFYRHKHRHTPPTSPKEPEKAALYHHNGPMYSEPPAYDMAYDNKALSIDKRSTLPITEAAPSSREKLVNSEEDTSLKKKRHRSSSYYVESHV